MWLISEHKKSGHRRCLIGKETGDIAEENLTPRDAGTKHCLLKALLLHMLSAVTRYFNLVYCWIPCRWKGRNEVRLDACLGCSPWSRRRQAKYAMRLRASLVTIMWEVGLQVLNCRHLVIVCIYENYIGCQSDAVSSSRWPHWCSRHWTAWHLHTWSTIATWSAMTFADYVQLSPSRVRYQGQGQGSVTDRSQSPFHESGTVCLLRCERLKITNSSKSCWKLWLFAFRRRVTLTVWNWLYYYQFSLFDPIQTVTW